MKFRRIAALFLAMSVTFSALGFLPVSNAASDYQILIEENFSGGRQEIMTNPNLHVMNEYFPEEPTVSGGKWQLSQDAWCLIGLNQPFGSLGERNMLATMDIVSQSDSADNTYALNFGVRVAAENQIFHSSGLWFMVKNDQIYVYEVGTQQGFLVKDFGFDFKKERKIYIEDTGSEITFSADNDKGEKTLLVKAEVADTGISVFNGKGEMLGKIENTVLLFRGYFQIMSHYAQGSVANLVVQGVPEKEAAVLNAFKRIGVENATQINGVNYCQGRSGTTLSDEGGYFLGNAAGAGSFCLPNIDFADGANYVEARIANGTTDTIIELRRDALDGPVIASFKAYGTAYPQDWHSDFGEVTDAVGIHDVYVILKEVSQQFTVSISDIRFHKERPAEMDKYDSYFQPENPNTNFRDTFSDTWVAADDLGRGMPTNLTCGNPKENKTVGVFYFIFKGNKELNPYHRVYDITKILAESPNNDPEKGFGGNMVEHFWAEPLFGYYTSEDEWVIRKHIQMLTDAGVDVIFLDTTNRTSYTQNLILFFQTFAQMRKEGQKTPQICFTTAANPGGGRTEDENLNIFLKYLYDLIYKNGYYKDLWFMWDGKPLILARMEQENVDPEFRDFFTFRKCWAFSTDKSWFGDGQHSWCWLDLYPQQFGWDKDSSTPEQISVTIGSHPTGNIGRSYHNGVEPSKEEQAPERGIMFAEQWSKALEVDPEIIFITGWNEWAQPRQHMKNMAPGVESMRFAGETVFAKDDPAIFVDTYNMEFSRDAEPMRGGYQDNYYYQMVNYIRRYKGVRPQFTASEKKTIALSDFAAWQTVSPEFRDNLYDTYRRSAPGFWSANYYVNDTGRNDIDIAKVARDDENVYFYVRCREDITPDAGENWMTLFINVDQDYTTGWYGYDFVVNRKTGILEKFVDGWKTEKIADIDFVVQGRELALCVPKSLLGLGDDLFTLDFKWADNSVTGGDIMDFYDKGDAAPNSRFNYRFTEKTEGTVQQVLNENEIQPTIEPVEKEVDMPGHVLRALMILKVDDPVAYAFGDKMELDVPPTIHADRTFVPLRFVAEALNAQVDYDNSTRKITISSNNKTVVLYPDAQTAEVDGEEVTLDAAPMLVNGRTLVPLRAVSSLLGYQVRWDDRGLVFIGKSEKAFMMLDIETVIPELLKQNF